MSQTVLLSETGEFREPAAAGSTRSSSEAGRTGTASRSAHATGPELSYFRSWPSPRTAGRSVCISSAPDSRSKGRVPTPAAEPEAGRRAVELSISASRSFPGQKQEHRAESRRQSKIAGSRGQNSGQDEGN